MIDRCSFHHLIFDMAGNGIHYGRTAEEGEEKRMISSSNMFQQLNSFPKMKYPYEYVDTHDVQEY